MTVSRRVFPALILPFLLIASALWSQTMHSVTRTGIWRGQKITYQWYPGKNGTGRAIYQGDILLENVLPNPPGPGPVPQSVGIAFNQYLWPKVGSVYQVPYTIDPASGDTANINTAITNFNNTFTGVIQFVPHTSEANYVDFNLDPNSNNGECEATEGDAGVGEQFATGAGGQFTPCTVATIEHEMGHIVGLWHEQARSDRDTYINVNYGAIIKASRGNFDPPLDTEGVQNFNLFDYASVMMYPAFSFSRNGEPCIESIPAGIPLSNQTGYTASDIDGIRRLYGAAPTSVTVTSNPPGLQVIVDGTTITTPQTFAWTLNSTHTLNVASGAQTLSGINYVYGRWNDSTTQDHTITVTPGDNYAVQPATSPAVTVYSANFIQLVPYTNTISPANSGTVVPSPAPQAYSGISGEYYIIRQPVTLTATPSSGQNFLDFINALNWLPGGISANPKTFYVMEDGTPINLTTNFTTAQVFTITTNPVEANLGVMIDTSNFYYAPVNFAWGPNASHTIGITSPYYPLSSNTFFTFNSWSDGGAQTHSITTPSTGNATYTANITGNYYVDAYANEGTNSGNINITPASTENGYYPSGTVLSIGETANCGLVFTGWLYDLTGTGTPQNLTVNDEVLVAADYNAVSAPLTITSLNPPSAVAGGNAFTLTINGTGFTNNTYFYVNGAYRQIANFISSTQVTVPIQVTDIATPGAFQVAVGNFPSPGCGPYVPATFFVTIGTGGGTPVASVSPTSESYSNVAVGTTSVSKTVKLSNTGTGALPISSIVASGDFVIQSNTCGSSLAVNSSCNITVTFNPTSAAAITGALSLYDGASNSPQNVKLTGTGIAPLTFSPTSLTFASTAVGSTSNQTLTVTNKQTTATTLSPTPSADYSITGGTCTSSLAASANCTIIVTFTPQYKGSIKGSLAIATNGAFSPWVVGLTGTATGGPTVPLSFSPTSLTFTSTGVGATAAAKTVTVTNKGTGAITINSITASADFSAAGSGTTPCGGALAKSAKCTLSVTFTPVDTGSIKGAVAIATNGAGTPQIVGLTGTGAAPITLAPTSLTFAAQTVGTTSAPQTITLTNNSGGMLTISSIVGSGDFTAAGSGTSPCGSSVASGATCTFSVTFTPSAKGSITGAATVSDNAPLSPTVVKLTGTGQ